MTEPTSREVISNQPGPHESLKKIVTVHIQTQFDKPIADYNVESFEKAIALADGRPIIFDSGCGTGKSTQVIAHNNPDAFVIGIDKSIHRLRKSNCLDKESTLPQNNAYLTRADIIDFWRLANAAKIRLQKHFILYPNPWPKKKHIQRRWHGSPVFRDMLAIGGELEIRSNWRIYIEEMQLALQYVGIDSCWSRLALDSNQYLTDFERKYHRSEQALWKLTACVGSSTSSL